MLQQEIQRRGLPPVWADGTPWPARRGEILGLLAREMYGAAPPAPADTHYIAKVLDENAFAGKAVLMELSVRFGAPKGEFSFPVMLAVPKSDAPVPLFVHIAFRPPFGDFTTPLEEIIDGGCAVAAFCYTDVATDDGNFDTLLPSMFPGAHELPDGWAKLAMWAWAASRVMDCVQGMDGIDRARVAVVGHSRLGKTALWCAANDERFALAVSNDSGCAGAALSRGKAGESVARIGTVFPFWFCGNFQKYVKDETLLPFDQHFVLAAVAPRRVYAASAENDLWADPASEFLGCVAASAVYEKLGLTGIVSEDRYPIVGEKLHGGRIAYHVRPGTHYLSRYDWGGYVEYIKRMK
jgi:hypothetical protein